jgi:hypothetical protein
MEAGQGPNEGCSAKEKNGRGKLYKIFYLKNQKRRDHVAAPDIYGGKYLSIS